MFQGYLSLIIPANCKITSAIVAFGELRGDEGKAAARWVCEFTQTQK
jgi:hypothetical protein